MHFTRLYRHYQGTDYRDLQCAKRSLCKAGGRPTTGGFPCVTRGHICASRIGLYSHRRTHPHPCPEVVKNHDPHNESMRIPGIDRATNGSLLLTHAWMRDHVKCGSEYNTMCDPLLNYKVRICCCRPRTRYTTNSNSRKQTLLTNVCNWSRGNYLLISTQ